MKGLAPLIVLALPVLMLWWLSSKAKRQQREVAAVNASLTVGTRVMTSSGLHGVITALTDDSIDLLVAPEVVTRWDRRAVVRTLDEPTAVTSVDLTPVEQTPVEVGRTPADDPDPPARP